MTDTAVNTSQMQISDEVAISIQNMNKWYGTFHVLHDIDLTVQRGAVSYTHLTLPTILLV